MTFKDIAIKNFKGSITRYITYFLCNSFIIMTFFMYSTLMFNEKLSSSSEIEKGVIDIFIMPSTVLLLFSVVFISYSHFTFIRARKKEFGIFMNLGMSLGDIRKIIFYENVLIGACSIILGIVSGLVFSRLFFLVIINLLDVTSIEYAIGLKNFAYSIGIFIVIFLVNMLVTMISTCGYEVINLLKADRKNQTNRFNSSILAGAALFIIIISSIRLYNAFDKGDVGDAILFESIILTLISTYILISQLGGSLLNLTRKNKKIYYKKMLIVTSLNSRFKLNKKIIFITSILIGVTIFYSGAMLRFYLGSEIDAVKSNTYDISYFQLGEKNKISSEDIEKIVTKNNDKITKQSNLEFIYYYGSEEKPSSEIVISESEINKLSNINVNKGEYIELYQLEKPKNYKEEVKSIENPLSDLITLEKSSDVFEKLFVSRNYQFTKINILHSDDYTKIKESNNIYIGGINLYNIGNWKNSDKIVRDIEEKLKTNNINKKPLKHEEEYLNVESKIGSYKYNRQGASVLLFTFSYLGVFFFVATSIVLFLKILSDIELDRKRFKSIYRIGATNKEMKKQIGKELLPLFFIGPFIGLVLAYIFTISFSADATGNISILMYCNFIIFIVFMIMQTIYFNICKHKYFKLLIRGSL